MKKLIALISLSLLPFAPAVAADEELQLGLRIGSGRIEIDSDQVLNANATTVKTLGIGGTIAFVTPFWLMVEGGGTSNGNFSWFGAEEEYKFNAYTAAVGLQYETQNGFRIVPKYGRVRWKLYNKEGAFRNPGPEEELTLRGYDYFWEITLAKKVKDSLALGVTVGESNFEFGNVRNIAFTAAFRL
jgi:hypothetical protein